MHVHSHAAKFSREIADHFARVGCVSIDINCQYWSIAYIDSDRSSQNFWLLQQVRRDFTLHSHNSSNGSMGLIQDACGRSSKGAERNENKDKYCEKFQG